MNIRPYQPIDREACLEIFRSNTPRYFDPTEEADFERWLSGRDRDELAYQTTASEHFFVGELHERIGACGGYYIVRTEPRANMVWGMVHAAFQGRQIGRQLLLHRIKEITATSPELTISLDTSQHTFPFFQKLGFAITRIQENCYGPGLDRYDMLLGPAANQNTTP